MVPLAQVEPLSQICLVERRKEFTGSFQSRVLRDTCLPSAPQLVHPALRESQALRWPPRPNAGGAPVQMWHNRVMLKGQCYGDKSRDGAHSPGREEMALSHTAQILAVTNSYQLFVRHLGTVPPDT